ncbi:MAG: ABC transporter ATP-binding protein [Bifidobacteriaceae bacterium]|nr:ABC transporter ATP-binding protein [Bifidobacteriaceae bacterium]
MVAQRLTKSFGHIRALDGLDVTVRRGEVAGFLGPNGAGKSTTIRILLGLLRADKDSGPAGLFGGDPWRDAVTLHRRLAYVPGEVSLWPTLSGGETIDLLGRLRGGLNPAKRAALIADFEFDPAKKVAAYSKGNRQKVALIAALASDAELLILDEPTTGLDPLMEAVFTAWIGRLKADGRTVLLSSHILAEVEKLCDTVTIIRAGRTVESGSLDEMRHLARSSVTVTTRDDPAGLATLPGIHTFTATGHRATFAVDDGALAPVMNATAALGVLSLVCSPPSLEELFLRHYGAAGAPTPVHAGTPR